MAAAPTQGRKQFPILGSQGAKIDWQLVAGHGAQARLNHSQTVERLAELGGLSWSELHAVLHNREWQKIDTNDAMIACRSLEARYLAAITTPPAAVVEAMEKALRAISERHIPDQPASCGGDELGWVVRQYADQRATARSALAALTAWRAGK